MTVAPGDADAVTNACRAAGIECAAIGRVTPASDGVALVSGGHPRPMPAFPQDEITRVFRATRPREDQ
jgi:hydrogenase maturation factor